MPSALTIPRTLQIVACVAILKTAATVLLSFPDYFPPNFDTDFLRGREPHFFGTYQWAFSAHVIAGPLSLLFGLFLLPAVSCRRWPKLHRVAGRAQVTCVLLVAVSGAVMSFHAMTGAVAGLGFGTLALATAVSVIRGWTSAMRRRLNEHRCWMQRCYVLLCSAVALRVIGGAGTVLQLDAEWIYPLSAWASWLVPLTIYEIIAVGCRTDVRAEPRA